MLTRTPNTIRLPASSIASRVRVASATVMVVVSACLVVPLGAQSTTAADTTLSQVIRQVYANSRHSVLSAARQVSAADYAYRPSPEVRSFGQLVAHVADVQYFFCAAGQEVPNPNEPNHRPGIVAQESLEAQLTSKAAILAAVEAAFEFCDPVFERVDDSLLDEQLTAAMQGRPRFLPLMLSIYHTAGHYGNMVTYLRQLGYTPTSG